MSKSISNPGAFQREADKIDAALAKAGGQE